MSVKLCNYDEASLYNKHICMGLISFEQLEKEVACKFFQRAIEIFPKNPEGFLYQIIALMQKDEI